ncbi:hypothetical protein L9F63_004610, partial [Diploptera punctata]
ALNEKRTFACDFFFLLSMVLQDGSSATSLTPNLEGQYLLAHLLSIDAPTSSLTSNSTQEVTVHSCHTCMHIFHFQIINACIFSIF